MTRKLKDQDGRSWRIELIPSEPENEDIEEEMLIRFTPRDEEVEECEIRVIGPVMEELPDLEQHEMALALEAALNETGFLFLDRDEHLWWVQSGEDDALADGAALVFVRGTDELRHPGPLSAPPEELSEDELQELLDQLLGRVIG